MAGVFSLLELYQWKKVHLEHHYWTFMKPIAKDHRQPHLPKATTLGLNDTVIVMESDMDIARIYSLFKLFFLG